MIVKRRGKLEIIADILRSIQSKGGNIKPTHLLYKSNLSHAKLKEYIDILQEKGMIEEQEEKGRKMYVMKDQGHKFLLEFEKVSDGVLPKPIPFTVEDLSNGDSGKSHHREIIWGDPKDYEKYVKSL